MGAKGCGTDLQPALYGVSESSARKLPATQLPVSPSTEHHSETQGSQ
jgi:hypothetical protein